MRSIVLLLAAVLALGLATPAPAPASAAPMRATLTPFLTSTSLPLQPTRIPAPTPAPAVVNEIRLVMRWTSDTTVQIVWSAAPNYSLWRAGGRLRQVWLTSDQSTPYVMGPGDRAYAPAPGDVIEIHTDGGLVLVAVPVPPRPLTPRAILPLVVR